MQLTLIAAMSENRVIGRSGQLPWHLPADLKHFKRATLDKPILMGRLTYDSIGRPLPRRRNLVLTRRTDFSPPGVEVFSSLEAVLESLTMAPELMVIGGGQVYGQCMPVCQRMLLTVVHCHVEGDAFFPAFDTSEWSQVDRIDHDADDHNKWAYSFIELRRGSSGKPVPGAFPRLTRADA